MEKMPRKKRISSRTRFVYQGFVYHNNVIAGTPPLRYLGCAEHKKSGCRGRATIPVGGWIEELTVTRPHNHPPDLNAEEKEAFLKELKSAVRSESMVYSTLKKVYETVAVALYSWFTFSDPGRLGRSLWDNSLTIDVARGYLFLPPLSNSILRIKSGHLLKKNCFFVDGYSYSIAYKTTDKTFLACACTKSGKCQARAYIPPGGDQSELIITRPHNHDPDFLLEKKAEIWKILKQFTLNLPGSPIEVYKSVVSIYPETKDLFPFFSVEGSIKRFRKTYKNSVSQQA